MALTDTFKVGQRVRVTDPSTFANGAEGEVVASNYTPHIAVCLYCEDGYKRFFRPDQLTSIEQAPASPPKPECYVTAFVLDEGYALTNDHTFGTKEEADAHAKWLVSTDHPESVSVFKLVSKHSSAVTVTSEDV